MLQKFVTSKKYYIWGLSQKGLELFLHFNENQVHGGPCSWIYAWFGLHIFFYQYIVSPLVYSMSRGFSSKNNAGVLNTSFEMVIEQRK